MKIVIDIPEEDYILAIKDDYHTIYGGMDSHIADAIKVGVRLPKNHGRLIDADELKTAFPCGESVRTECVRATIDYATTIIESDKESEKEE